MPQHTPMVPALSPPGYDAARGGAALIDRSGRGRIVVSGKDRASYLQGLLTNDIAALKSGEGCYAAYLTAQGRMITDLWVYELGDVIVIELPGETKDAVLARLDQFIFTEDVQLGDVTDAFAGVTIVGPDAPTVIAHATSAGVDLVRGLRSPGAVRLSFGEHPIIILRSDDAGVDGFEVLAPAEQREPLVAALHAAGAVAADIETAEALRIEGGVARFGGDMDEQTIPLEAGIESRAISLTKGCYVGQEVIVRVLHRGHGRVARKLVGLSLDGSTVPAARAVVRSDAREIGHVTSSTWSPVLGRPIALAYVHREFVEPGTRVTVEGQGAEVSKLPFVPGDAGRT